MLVFGWTRCARGMMLIGMLLAPALSPSVAQETKVEIPADSEMTLVTGTRFVTEAAGEATAKAQFTHARIPLSAFNKTDHCIDERALEVATEYFNGLGRELAKAGHYYFLPNSEVAASAVSCEKLHGAPHAWAAGKTDIIAFGRVVPTVMASDLEQSIR